MIGYSPAKRWTRRRKVCPFCPRSIAVGTLWEVFGRHSYNGKPCPSVGLDVAQATRAAEKVEP